LKNYVIVPYCLYEKALKKFPKRKIEADRSCPNNEYYYWNSRGILRAVHLPDGKICALDWDNFPYATILKTSEFVKL